MKKSKWIGLVLLVLAMFPSCQEKKVLIAGKIKELSDLATVEFKLKRMIYNKEQNRFLFLKSGTSTYLSEYAYFLKVGVKLENSPDDIVKEIGEKSIKLKLPALNVLSWEKKEVGYSRFIRNGFLNKITLEDETEYSRRALREINKLLNHIGIRSLAEDKTRSLITNFLKKIGYVDIRIEFEPGDLKLY